MNPTPNKQKYITIALISGIGIAALLIVYYILFRSESFFGFIQAIVNVFMPIIYGLIIAYIMNPALVFFERKWESTLAKRKKRSVDKRSKLARTLAIASTSIVYLAVIAIFIIIFISQIVPSVQEIANNIDIYSKNVTDFFDKTLSDNPELEGWIQWIQTNYGVEFENFLDTIILPITSIILMNVSVSILSILGTFWNLIIGFIISLYILGNKETFASQGKKLIYGVLSISKANNLITDLRFVHKTFTGFIFGKVIDSIIIGLLCMIGTSIIGTPYAALVSIFIGFTNVIPFFGPFIGAIPSAILIFVVAPTEPLNLLYFLIFILLLQQFDGNILGPKILGDSTGLSAFWVIFSIIVFGGFFGVPGMIIGVPTFAVIFAAMRRYINGRLTQKQLPTDRSNYDGLGTIINGEFVPYEGAPKQELLNKKILGSKKRKSEES